ncbi:hypothetical protein GQ54DRAFT_261977 [Martensiomyces pterosporus]|nr:hypothetical protein GQ54DRAFT_261977 [Martensiomyces pterosporus]
MTGPITLTSPSPKSTTVATNADVLTAEERDDLLNQAEWGFRKWLKDTGPQTGFVMYPSTRQILKSLNALYKTLDDVDFSDIFQ